MLEDNKMSKELEASGDQIKDFEDKEIFTKGPSFGKRHVQAILLFLGITVEVMTRSSLSLSIVAMTDNTTSNNPDVPTYNWSDTNIILSSFYWGYVVLQVLAGQLAKTYGPRWLLFAAMSTNAFATTIIPFTAEIFGSKGVMACRILQGLSQGGIYPCCHTMLGRWAPKSERGRMSTFVYSGMSIGTIICLPITGLISKSYFGWPVSFYLFGCCGFIWSGVWLYFGHNSPASHPHISQEEKYFIEYSLNQDKDLNVIPTPWKEMLTSIPFWALVIPTIGSGYGVIFLQNEIPSYLEKVMKYDISSSGYLTSMTAGVGVIMTYIYGPLSDFLIEHRYLSRVNTRKLFEVISNFGNAAALLTLAYLDASQAYLSVLMLTVSSAFGSALLFGHGVNPIDLSPRFSGIILGFANSLSCFAALAAPLSVQYIVTDETNASEWRLVYILAALTFTIPSIIFVLFASGDRQWWDDGAQKERPDRVQSEISDKIEKV